MVKVWELQRGEGGMLVHSFHSHGAGVGRLFSFVPDVGVGQNRSSIFFFVFFSFPL